MKLVRSPSSNSTTNRWSLYLLGSMLVILLGTAHRGAVFADGKLLEEATRNKAAAEFVPQVDGLEADGQDKEEERQPRSAAADGVDHDRDHDHDHEALSQLQDDSSASGGPVEEDDDMAAAAPNQSEDNPNEEAAFDGAVYQKLLKPHHSTSASGAAAAADYKNYRLKTRQERAISNWLKQQQHHHQPPPPSNFGGIPARPSRADSNFIRFGRNLPIFFGLGLPRPGLLESRSSAAGPSNKKNNFIRLGRENPRQNNFIRLGRQSEGEAEEAADDVDDLQYPGENEVTRNGVDPVSVSAVKKPFPSHQYSNPHLANPVSRLGFGFFPAALHHKSSFPSYTYKSPLNEAAPYPY